MIVREDGGVSIIGGGVVYPGTLEMARELAPVLVAADGAAAVALKAGWVPMAVIGDLDSLDTPSRRALPSEHIHYISEQDSTDFDKCLRNISAPFVLAIGFTGARLDHELAALSTLAQHPDVPCIIIGEQDMCFLAPEDMELVLPVATRVSLFPLAEVRGWSTGLRWPIEGHLFSPDKRVGTSNETTSTTIGLHFSRRKMLLMLPIEHLRKVLTALAPNALP